MSNGAPGIPPAAGKNKSALPFLGRLNRKYDKKPKRGTKYSKEDRSQFGKK
jgi:hypothetical protein